MALFRLRRNGGYTVVQRYINIVPVDMIAGCLAVEPNLEWAILAPTMNENDGNGTCRLPHFTFQIKSQEFHNRKCEIGMLFAFESCLYVLTRIHFFSLNSTACGTETTPATLIMETGNYFVCVTSLPSEYLLLLRCIDCNSVAHMHLALSPACISCHCAVSAEWADWRRARSSCNLCHISFPHEWQTKLLPAIVEKVCVWICDGCEG